MPLDECIRSSCFISLPPLRWLYFVFYVDCIWFLHIFSYRLIIFKVCIFILFRFILFWFWFHLFVSSFLFYGMPRQMKNDINLKFILRLILLGQVCMLIVLPVKRISFFAHFSILYVVYCFRWWKCRRYCMMKIELTDNFTCILCYVAPF